MTALPDAASVTAALQTQPGGVTLPALAALCGVAPGSGFTDHIRALVLSGEVGPDEAGLIRSSGRIPPTAFVRVTAGRSGPTGRFSDSKGAARVSLRGPLSEGLTPGETVLVRLAPREEGYYLGWVLKVGGSSAPDDDPIARILAAESIRVAFPSDVTAQASLAAAVLFDIAGREDLRAIPFVTIDGSDARDFDDAVWASAGVEGFRVIVAIADVAHYVAAGSVLDREAAVRGTSVYGPDVVVPMLPPALSEGACSLQPDEDRPCVFVDMQIDPNGIRSRVRIGRGVMRSHARLTYEQVEGWLHGAEDCPDRAMFAALAGAEEALNDAFRQRGGLDLRPTECRLERRGDGFCPVRRERLRSHRVIEALMREANAAIAEHLRDAGATGVVFRRHAAPTGRALRSLSAALLQQSVTADALPQVLQGAEILHDVVLRALRRAEYCSLPSPHYGLALGCYTHATSPIRRYADLLVQRALVVLLGCDSVVEGTAVAVGHLNMTEARAGRAARALVDRHIFAYMRDKTDTTLTGYISEVTPFGLCVVLDETGVNGLLPLSALPRDVWMLDDRRQTLIARQTGASFPLGTRVEVTCTPTADQHWFLAPAHSALIADATVRA